ncbi:oxidoreductase [Bosea sp. NBC_00550]|uniref:oxidoreductase n=1 Tax=Bosea sp. NBC_00550 TaxID=2969621 RepID=UPI0022320BA8|nr:oxidoreductase [Bosea sp. NBC_00550]UZF94945.1 oxidoreductase [Bosea sp. NBC_00550]
MSHLFDPLDIGPVRVPNRIAIAPMCQYSASDGCASDWHLQHLPMLAMSGAGLVMVEMTGIERAGRITHGCLGLYSDDNERALARVLAAAKAVALPGTRFGIQIGHAGRKGSAHAPWNGGSARAADDDSWPTVSASPIPFDDGWPAPAEASDAQLDRIRAGFAVATRRAINIGFDVIELHMAHGYLLHQFLSPLANQRLDRWADLMSFPLCVAEAVAAEVPDSAAWGARITGSDWVEGGITPQHAIALAHALASSGASYVDVTSGAITPKVRVTVAPGYQVPFADEVKKAVPSIVVRAVGMIVDPTHADAIISGGQADQIAVARAVLNNPRWGWHAADRLGIDLPRPPQYARAAPNMWPGAAYAR